MRGNDFSQLRRVAEKKTLEIISKNSSDNKEEASILEDLTKMLGGGFG
ncbi:MULTISPECIES: hypothetical protein [Photorhabdus]|nr:hypothetical protein [Photorhabdus aegyptia]MCC8456852.1 hypothetical protein [Photorhabdus aegyptia]